MRYDFGYRICCVGATSFQTITCGNLATNAHKTTVCGYTSTYRIGEIFGDLRIFALGCADSGSSSYAESL